MSAAAGMGEAFAASFATTSSVSIDALLRELIPDLLRYFVSRVEDREDAADAVADTLLVLWRKAKELPTEHEDARRYAFGVARRVLANTRRGAQRRNALADRLRTVIRDEPIADKEPDLELRAALAALSAADRELVLLVAWDGFSLADAGRILGIRHDAARTRYSRARARLRAHLTNLA